MRSPLVAAIAALTLVAGAGALGAQDFKDPKSSVAFAIDNGDLVLLGTGLRVKKIAFLKFDAYAFGVYIDKAATEGPLAPFKGKPASDEMRKVLQAGDFKKELVLHFLRDLDAQKIQDAMREALKKGTDPKVLDQFISYFPEVKDGERCTLRWAPGGTIETVMVGVEKPPITNRAFAEKLFGLYVGPTPLQEDFKAGTVARFGATGAPSPVRQAEGTVQSVQPNGFTITDANGKELVFTATSDTAIVARGASHKMDELREGGKPATIGEFVAPRQKVSVKYVEVGGKLILRDVQVR